LALDRSRTITHENLQFLTILAISLLPVQSGRTELKFDAPADFSQKIYTEIGGENYGQAQMAKENKRNEGSKGKKEAAIARKTVRESEGSKKEAGSMAFTP
jgi:hypothetical protein